jgi:hypothetical protein
MNAPLIFAGGALAGAISMFFLLAFHWGNNAVPFFLQNLRILQKQGYCDTRRDYGHQPDCPCHRCHNDLPPGGGLA